MKIMVLLTIATSAVSIAAPSAAEAATKHRRHAVHERPAVVETVPPGRAQFYPGPTSYGPAAYGFAPGRCVTDEGGGRVSPCDYGGGRGGGGHR
jgi:hypothetical protein